jgi:hypothetical protein
MIDVDSMDATMARAAVPQRWRDDMRLFAFVWAAGFLFVSALLA